LVFVFAVNSFGVPVLLGTPAGLSTITTRIYQDLALSADPAAFTRVIVLAVGLVVVTVAAVAVSDAASWLRGAAIRTAAPSGPAGSAGRSVGATAGVWLYAALTSLVPFAALALTALTRAVGLDPVPANWTTANFGEAVSGAGAAFRTSLLLALAAAVLGVVLGAMVAALDRGRLGTTVVLTFAVPGSALAVAVLLAYGGVLGAGTTIILVAYLAKFWALGHRPIAGSLGNLPPDLTFAARASGATPGVVLRTVLVPLLRPALAAAALLVFLFALHELTMSALLYGPGSETLAVVVLNLRQLGDVTLTAALAVTLTLVLAAATLPLLAVRRRARKWTAA
jgi:iron(III) transport system permease protein